MSFQDGPDLYLGLWVLDPSQARYELGQPPRKGFYRIEPDGDRLKFTAEWETQEGQAHQVTFWGFPDGTDHPFAESPLADTLNTTRIDGRTLDTTVKKDGVVTAHARRLVSPDGQTMHVTQSGRGVDGSWHHNVSIYHRQPEEKTAL